MVFRVQALLTAGGGGQIGRKIYLENARSRGRNGEDKHIKHNWMGVIDGHIDEKIER